MNHVDDVFEEEQGNHTAGSMLAPYQQQREGSVTDQLAALAGEYMDILDSWADLDTTMHRPEQSRQAGNAPSVHCGLHGFSADNTKHGPPARGATGPVHASHRAGAVRVTAGPSPHADLSLDLKAQVEGPTRTNANDVLQQSLGLVPMGKAPVHSVSWSSPMPDVDMGLVYGLGENSAAHSSARSSTTRLPTTITTAKRSASESHASLDVFGIADGVFSAPGHHDLTASSAASQHSTPPPKRSHRAKAGASFRLTPRHGSSPTPSSTAKITTAAAPAQDIAKLARLAKVSKRTKGGFCLGCGMVKPLEMRKSLLKKGKFAICNACRKTHLYRISAEMKAWEAASRLQLLGSGVSAPDALTIMRTALVHQWQDSRMSRIMNLALLADASHIAFSLLLDSNLSALQATVARAVKQQRSLQAKPEEAEQLSSNTEAMESFSHISVLGQVYHVGFYIVACSCRKVISTGVRQAVCAFLNEAMTAQLAMPAGPSSLPFVLDEHGLILSDLTPWDVEVLYAD